MEIENKANENEEPESQVEESQEIKIKKRFASHVMETVAGQHYTKVMAVLKSTDNLQEGLAKALYMIMEVARKKMQQEGVEVPPELYVGSEGLLAASMMILLKIVSKEDIKPSKEDVQQAMAQVSQLLTQSLEGGQQQQMPPQGAPMPQQAPQQQMPQQAPQQGLLNKGAM